MKKNNFLIKLGDFIVNFRFVFLILFIGLTIFCGFNLNNVKINDSIVSYLPNNTETKKGLDIMDNEFKDLSVIKVMVSNITIEDAKSITNDLSKIKNIDTVLFDENTSFKNDNALYTIQTKDLNDKEITNLKEDIDEVINDKEYYITSESFESPTDGIEEVLLLACIVILIILFITSKTYFEPVIAFIVFGISIILNMGSNFLFGEISFITKSIAVILQLALSIDYVIIFMNQYMKEINDTNDKILAIKKTVSKSIPEIFASSLTTISGLLALCFMQLKIGGDIGLVLSKGIICSLLTVILVMPSLLDIFSNIILKLKKKEKNTCKADKLSNFIFKWRKLLLPMFLICVIISIFLVPKYNYVYNSTSASSINKSENTLALEKIEDEFGKDNTLVILFKNTNKDYSKELKLVKELEKIDEINSITSIGGYNIYDDIYLGTKINYLEFSNILNINIDASKNLYKLYASTNNELQKLTNIDDYRISIIDFIYFLNENKEQLPLTENIKTQIDSYYSLIAEKISLFESDDYTRIIINLDSKVEDQSTYDIIEDIRDITEKEYNDVLLIGNSINAIDLESSFTSDNFIITSITILFIAIILMFTFKSFGATLLLILTIEGSILINFGIMALMQKEIFFMGYVVVSAIQMGATIDYAIVITSRYLELRKKQGKKLAIVNTLNDRLPAVITSGLILLIAGFLIGFITPSSVISQIGLFLGVGTLISLIGTVFVLPPVLYLCDSFIKKTTIRKE